ncbi:MAG: DUF1259 domain-containing protein [Rhodopila sp.]
MRSTTFAACAALGLTTAMTCSASESDWQPVAAALGKAGTEMPGGVYRIGLPRSDLHVMVDGVMIRPTLALGSWLAFRQESGATVVMGDLVLTETEIAPVMAKLAENGIEITALHNHLLRASPATFYMHVHGHGDGPTLAAALHDGLALSHTPLAAPSSSAPPASAAATTLPELDTAMLDRTFGVKGRIVDGVYQVGIPRSEVVRDDGMEVPVAMGSAEAIGFQPTGNGRAAITGDFVLTAAEVNPLLRTLERNHIEVTALHNHMLMDEPRLFFMHFWANDDAQALAKGLREALDKIGIRRS